VAIDIYSRCITGFCLSLEAPGAVSVGLCLAHSILDKESWMSDRKIDGEWPIWGKPDCIHVDNAAEFHSEALRRGCEQHGIQINYRPMGHPHYGGAVERAIDKMRQITEQAAQKSRAARRKRARLVNAPNTTAATTPLEDLFAKPFPEPVTVPQLPQRFDDIEEW
jgi:transposase InsO family protein